MSEGARRLSVSGLRVGYGRQVVAEVRELHLAPGTIWLITGPNGSGKTTLLKTLARLLRPVSGVIAPLPPRGSGGAVFVHSSPVLFRGSLRHNLAVTGGTADEITAAAHEFGLDDRLDQPVHELSHGMRQRAALARAVLSRPSLLLLDEPEGGLDESALALWRAFVTRVVGEGRITLVIAAHRPAGLEGLSVRMIELPGETRRPAG
jgi:ABC-type multidrug transport system ATPase subunit